MAHKKPIIGIVGGIGSGKTFVARLFGELGGLVISSDDEVRKAYDLPEVKQALHSWWGDSVFLPTGEVDRHAVAGKVFADAGQRQRLENLLHPLVNQSRHRIMDAHQLDPQIKAFIWDTPLLFEAALNTGCDAIVFVDSPLEDRLKRVQAQRGWDLAELTRREKSQWPLDKKREMSDYVVRNTGPADQVREQVQQVLSLILNKSRYST